MNRQCRQLTSRDTHLFDRYVKLLINGVERMASECELSVDSFRKISPYLGAALKEDLPLSRNARYIGHFTDGSFDGQLIESYDLTDGEIPTAIIQWMAVENERAGIGSSIVRDFLYRTSTTGAQVAKLGVHKRNQKALRFYNKFGFEVTTPVNSDDLIEMARELD